LIFGPIDVCVYEKTDIFEHDRADTEPKADLQSPFDPIISVLLFIFVQKYQHITSNRDKQW